MFGHMSTQDKICSDNGQMLIEMYSSIIFWLGHLSDQTDLFRSTPKVLEKCQMSDCYFMLCKPKSPGSIMEQIDTVKTKYHTAIAGHNGTRLSNKASTKHY